MSSTKTTVIAAYESMITSLSEKMGHQFNDYEKLLLQMGFINGLNASVIALSSGIDLATPDLENLIKQESADE